ncbi:Hypothetical protein SSCIU_00159 [Mammaliicoccus sciuri]|nr:Hypothetical protein SSCIU_00159 [Mammaliicoccus sciuri]
MLTSILQPIVDLITALGL